MYTKFFYIVKVVNDIKHHIGLVKGYDFKLSDDNSQILILDKEGLCIAVLSGSEVKSFDDYSFECILEQR